MGSPAKRPSLARLCNPNSHLVQRRDETAEVEQVLRVEATGSGICDQRLAEQASRQGRHAVVALALHDGSTEQFLPPPDPDPDRRRLVRWRPNPAAARREGDPWQ